MDTTVYIEWTLTYLNNPLDSQSLCQLDRKSVQKYSVCATAINHIIGAPRWPLQHMEWVVAWRQQARAVRYWLVFFIHYWIKSMEWINCPVPTLSCILICIIEHMQSWKLIKLRNGHWGPVHMSQAGPVISWARKSKRASPGHEYCLQTLAGNKFAIFNIFAILTDQ